MGGDIANSLEDNLGRETIKYFCFFDKKTGLASLFLSFDWEINIDSHSDLYKKIPKDFIENLDDDIILDGSIMSVLGDDVWLDESFEQVMANEKNNEIEILSRELKRAIEEKLSL